VVLVIGLPASGKSTMAQVFTERGFVRLNRDEQGGTLRKLLPALQRTVEDGATRIVLDNTYATRAARGAVVQWASQHGLPVRCIWMTTGLDDAQVNAAERIVRKYGRLLEPDEIRAASRRDPNTFGPAVLFRYQREFEPPDPSEGFSTIEAVPFTRRREPGRTGRAVLVWCDGVLARSRSGRRVAASVEDLEVLRERRVVLERSMAEGYRVIALSWQPEVDDGVATRQEVDAIFARMVAELAVPMDVLYCPHRAGPPVCWCRNPLPGLGVLAIERYALDPAASLVVGRGPQDPGFARKLGMAYRDATAFFGDSASPGDSDGGANQRGARDVNNRS
jgi:histidinol phosphatase-like enzyme/predicted kinase